MRDRKTTLILVATAMLVVLLLKSYIDFHEGVMHLKSDGKEFKKKPENSIESTILHREKEVYNHVFLSDN